ncbi:AraC-like DNA-binding protein [Variovorax boronicumulans]|uniref:helix-turn-helix transcriptional regulator n=1 Tax=Variovorax boronicumulans TaxID=436515 RepID=UPI002787035E|nr:helix-turn-helix transcriptional regulator [Variovorax boronicumulans]MDP9989603.1 AraC-like DNA-binding protein [Variovorax boronicumulans]MDQ0007718.1 AraC-like DNA-binding protein [Variovorax boronicumulans]
MAERLFLRLDDDPLHGPESGVPAGTLRAVPVSAALQAHVSHILLYRETFAAGHEVRERVLPDGAVRLVFNLGDAPSAGDGAGLPVEAIGASAAPVVVRMRDTVEGISVTLRPGAAAALLGLPAGEVAGQAIHLDELWQGDAAELLARMAEAPDDAARAVLLQSVLERRLLDGRGTAHHAAMHAARLISESGGRKPLRDVAAAVGVGERRLQQLFHAHVGLSPRAWARLARLHDCLRALRLQSAPAWADVAVESGFYDQSHLVNEFRALCGVTPTEFMGHAISGSSKTPG